MIRLVFVRHGQSEHNKRFFSFIDLNSQSDSTLTNKGKLEIESTVKTLIDYQPTIIYSSPLIRTVQTAQIIQTAFEKTKNINLVIEKDDRLNQLGFSFPATIKNIFRRSDRNIKQDLFDFINQLKTKHPDQTVFVVGHFHTYCLLLNGLSGFKISIGIRGLLQNRIKTGQHKQILIK